jgi:hypothetical protein
MTKPPKTEAPFRFDAALSVDVNIQSFLAVLDKRDPALADIFRKNIGTMLPLPSDGGSRSAARLKFSSSVAKAIDALDTL